jgi:2,5-diamino-6-(ribosylamino)-4(3H)-pyrimidinone 5'-phosphate reductase
MAVRPTVTTSSGVTLDGRLLDWGQRIQRRALSAVAGPGALFQGGGPGVVLTGADTLWPFPGNPAWPTGVDRPPAAAPVIDGEEDLTREALAPGRRWLAVTDSRGRLPDAWFTFFLSQGTVPPWPGGPTGLGAHHRDRELLMLVADATPRAYLAYLRSRGIVYLVAGQDRVDLAGALEIMATEMAVQDVVVDGGSKLSHALLAAGLIDRVRVEIAPVILGAAGMTLFQVEGAALPAGIVLVPVDITVKPNGTVDALYAVNHAGEPAS